MYIHKHVIYNYVYGVYVISLENNHTVSQLRLPAFREHNG